MIKNYYIYIITNKKNGTLYTGVTSDLKKRIYGHKNKLVDGFSKKYNLDKLVYYESTNSIESAIIKEKQIKKWKRQYKLNVINHKNPEWNDLYKNLDS
jgi:putative endonuclease